MGIPMRFHGTIKAFNQPVLVEHFGVGYNEAGVWQETYLNNEQVRAIILLLNTEQLQLLQQGEQSDAGINIICNKELYFSDNRYPEKNGIQKQSYVYYGGYKYRVVGTSLLEFNTRHYAYTALRSLK